MIALSSFGVDVCRVDYLLLPMACCRETITLAGITTENTVAAILLKCCRLHVSL